MTFPRAAVWLFAAGLTVGGVFYHARGVKLFLRDDGAVDLKLRWQEQQYVLRGQNPYDVTYAALGVGKAPKDSSRNAASIPELGFPDSGGYPPWAFAIGPAFYWPSWPAVKTYFLAVSLAMTAVTMWWAFAEMRSAGGEMEHAALASASVFAISAYCTSCQVGQYGAVVTALLALSCWALTNRRDAAGGLLLGMSMLKPTISGPFGIVLLFAERWRGLAACVGWLVAASAAVWVQTKTNPLEMLSQMLAAGSEFVHDSQGLVSLALQMGLTPKQATPALAAAILLPGILVMWTARRRPMVDQFAVAAVIGRLWAYHKTYDNMMMAFLLVALLRTAAVGRSPIAWAGFLVAGAVTWAPASLTKSDAFVYVQIVGWAAGLAALLSVPPIPDKEHGRAVC